MKITKENIQLLDTVRHFCNTMELTENKDYYFLTLHGVEGFNIQTIVDNAQYYKSSIFYSYSYNFDNQDLILTFKKIED